MPKITEDKELILTTAEAVKLIKNAYGETSKVRFMVPVRAFLPTESDHNLGFDGVAFTVVTRAEMIKIVRNILGEVLEGRGARIRLKLHKGNYGVPYISI